MKKLNHLDNNAKNLLDKISENEILKNFVLVGGSGLAIHLGHRISEDLDFLNKELGLQQLTKLGKLHIPSFQIKFFHTALTYIDDIEEDNIDYLRPLENISINQIRDYFIKQIKESKNIYE